MKKIIPLVLLILIISANFAIAADIKSLKPSTEKSLELGRKKFLDRREIYREIRTNFYDGMDNYRECNHYDPQNCNQIRETFLRDAKKFFIHSGEIFIEYLELLTEKIGTADIYKRDKMNLLEEIKICKEKTEKEVESMRKIEHVATLKITSRYLVYIMREECRNTAVKGRDAIIKERINSMVEGITLMEKELANIKERSKNLDVDLSADINAVEVILTKTRAAYESIEYKKDNKTLKKAYRLFITKDGKRLYQKSHLTLEVLAKRLAEIENQGEIE